MAVEVRPGISDDLPVLLELYRQLHAGETTTTLDELAEGFSALRDHPGCELFVAAIDDRVVGTFVLYILPNMTHNGRPAAIIENIIVDDQCRRSGVGRAMMNFARDRAQALHCYKLSLTSNAQRTNAHAFYTQCGMMQHGVSFRFALE